MGGTVGAIAGHIACAAGLNPVLFNNFIIIAMAGYFTAIVRAPLTGVVLLLEMTGSFQNLLPMMAVSLIAFVTADLLHSKPIYESLLENLLGNQYHGSRTAEAGKITLEMPVHFDSPSDGKLVRDLGLPQDCLLIAIRREGKDLIPKGDTQVLAGDSLVFLMSQKDEADYREMLTALTEAQ